MNPIWLVLIIPLSVGVGFAVGVAFVIAVANDMGGPKL